MCHSYGLPNVIDDLSSYFNYGEETKFWLYLLYLCEIKNWQGADMLINSKIASNKISIAPGATEVLWEFGRYESSFNTITGIGQQSTS